MTTTARRARPDEGAARSRARPVATMVVTGMVLAAMAIQMFFTLVVNVPYPDVKYRALPGAAADAYMRPFFVQDYRIFAPNPASEDRQLWVRAWVSDASGRPVTTEWVNTTAVELAEPYRRTLRKQLTIVGAERLMAGYRALSDEQRAIVAGNYHQDGGTAQLTSDLTALGSARGYLQASDYTTGYATQVAEALWGDRGEVLAVQTRAVYAPVVRWSQRDDPDAQRPRSTYTDLGWREPLEYPGQDSAEFARTFRAWYSSAGEKATQ